MRTKPSNWDMIRALQNCEIEYRITVTATGDVLGTDNLS